MLQQTFFKSAKNENPVIGNKFLMHVDRNCTKAKSLFLDLLL